MDETAKEAFARGLALVKEGGWPQALGAFDKAQSMEPENACFRSYYGLCLGIVERRFEEAAELCASSAKQEFFNPEMYLNLARLHLSFGFRSEGVRFLRRGRMIDPGHQQIAAELHNLGQRNRPVLRFLPRGHTLNRWIGAMRHGLTRALPPF